MLEMAPMCLKTHLHVLSCLQRQEQKFSPEGYSIYMFENGAFSSMRGGDSLSEQVLHFYGFGFRYMASAWVQQRTLPPVDPVLLHLCILCCRSVVQFSWKCVYTAIAQQRTSILLLLSWFSADMSQYKKMRWFYRLQCIDAQ